MKIVTVIPRLPFTQVLHFVLIENLQGYYQK